MCAGARPRPPGGRGAVLRATWRPNGCRGEGEVRRKAAVAVTTAFPEPGLARCPSAGGLQYERWGAEVVVRVNRRSRTPRGISITPPGTHVAPSPSQLHHDLQPVRRRGRGEGWGVSARPYGRMAAGVGEAAGGWNIASFMILRDNRRARKRMQRRRLECGRTIRARRRSVRPLRICGRGGQSSRRVERRPDPASPS